MKIYVLGSGSDGNCTIFEDDGVLLLIDMGLTLKRLKEGLSLMNKTLIDLDALLLTHEHVDHTKGVRYLNPLPIYCTKGTYDSPNVIEITPYKEFHIGSLSILPLSTSHDVIDPVGFVIKNKKGERFVYMTDTGYIPDDSLPYMFGAEYYMIESNHDIKMLHETHRPERLKERILSDFGHLSNVDSANYVCDLISKNTKEVILAHLSREANTHEVALETHYKIYKKRHIDVSNIHIVCANQYEPTICGEK